MLKIETIMRTLGAIGFFGLGLWFGSYYSERYTAPLGMGLVFIVAVTAVVLYYTIIRKQQK